MKNIPAHIQSEFKATLNSKDIPANQHSYFLKWRRFYLDFCDKYTFDPHDPQSLPHFLEKLQSKRQGTFQQQQATEAVRIFLAIYSLDTEKTIATSYKNISEEKIAEAKGMVIQILIY